MLSVVEASEDVCLTIVLLTLSDSSLRLRMTKTAWILNLELWTSSTRQLKPLSTEYSFTSTGNNSHFSVFSLFHQKEKVRNGTFFVYICNVKRSEDWKLEVRVHTCRQPCAHGRLSFFRHSTIGCAYGQQSVCTRPGGDVPTNGWNV